MARLRQPADHLAALSEHEVMQVTLVPLSRAIQERSVLHVLRIVGGRRAEQIAPVPIAGAGRLRTGCKRQKAKR